MAARGRGRQADNNRLAGAALEGVLRPGYIARGLIATAMVAGLFVGSPDASGQDKPAAALNQPAVDPAPPAPAAALDMFNGVAEWVKRWQTPMDPIGQPPVHAAAVTLRYEGSIVGRGVAISGDSTLNTASISVATSTKATAPPFLLPSICGRVPTPRGASLS